LGYCSLNASASNGCADTSRVIFVLSQFLIFPFWMTIGGMKGNVRIADFALHSVDPQMSDKKIVEMAPSGIQTWPFR
jgi:hypothetical protein